jgi:hypothetical protein
LLRVVWDGLAVLELLELRAKCAGSATHNPLLNNGRRRAALIWSDNGLFDITKQAAVHSTNRQWAVERSRLLLACSYNNGLAALGIGSFVCYHSR